MKKFYQGYRSQWDSFEQNCMISIMYFTDHLNNCMKDHWTWWSLWLVICDFYPIHKFLWSFVKQHNFLNFLVKKEFFDCLSILYPIGSTFGHMICGKISIVFFIPPSFWSFGDVDQFRKFVSKIFYSRSEFLDNMFKLLAVGNVSCLHKL